ncbi:MAG TPA: Ig-like domain repeat protein [Candidatus Sulfotelmatobacter sp.]|nr:Ig-like domain repeat protein [Candidatus Sulfotelmatobacter sp.]
MKRAPKGLLILLVLFCFAGLLKATLPQILIGNWTTTSNLSQARSNAASVLLADGRILIIGGDGGSGALQSAEFFGTDGTVSAAAAMNGARSRHFAVVMGDGRVLVGGGTTTGGGTTNTAEIYDPSANSWTQISPLTTARANATAAVLQDGRVLIAGGDNSGVPNNTIEIYDPSTGNFSFAGTLSSPRTQHAMAVLQDGRVLIVGGFDGTNSLASSDIFDPVAGSISAGPNLATARYAHSATTLFNGQVAVIGGAGAGANGTVDLASIELFDPMVGTFTTSSATLTTAREGHQAFLLPNNNSVVIAGGTSTGVAQASAEMFTPQISTSNGAWTYAVTATGSINSARAALTGSANQANGPTSTVTPKPGFVFVAGGTDANSNALNSTEAYGYPTVQTDQGDYPPGTTVNISGNGFKAGESVAITLVESPLIDTHGPYTVTADANGNIADSSFTTDSHDLNVRFFLNVVGSQSGVQAQNTFTDSKPNTVTVGTQSPNPVAPGSAAQYTVTVNFNGNGNPCTSPLSVNSALPTGATASFSPSSVTGTNGSNVNSSLTITTTGATPPGSTNFTVLAANGGGQCQAGTATGSGTLIVVENTTTSLATSLTPSTFGQSVTLTATVAKVTGPTTPTGGTVTFLDGATQIGTATLSNGTATLPISTLTAGSHSLTASYGGVTNQFGASTSSAINQTVNEASTTTSVSSASGTAGQGSVTLNANVTANSPSTATVNEGTVTFTVKQGATTIGTVTSGTVTGGAASANFSLTSVSAGSYSISATYNPATTNPNFTTSTAATPGTLTVNATSTTTTVSSSTNPSAFGQSVTFTAKIAPASGTATPTGTVQFVVDGSNFGTPVNVASCAPSPDACATSISTSTVSVGPHSVVANYSGDGNYSASSSTTLTQTVNEASTTTTLTSSANPSVFGQSVTFTASVTINAPGTGTIPTGETVTFKDGASTLGTGTTNAAGVATFTTSSLSVATHSVTAVYAGDTNFATSTSNTVSQVVTKAATTTSITSDLSTATVVGQSYSVSASVAVTAPGAGTIPNGDTVTVSDGTASCTITLNSAAGSCNLTSTTAGAKTVTATYNGDQNFNGSASAGVAHTVNKANTTTAISSNTPNPSTVGQAVTINYSVSVNSPGAGTPTGNVTVSDGVGDSCTASVAANSCQITFNTAGTKTLTATYAGDTNFNTSASTTANQTVNPKLAFTSAVFATLTGLCSPQISVQIQNANGSAATLTTATVLNPSSSSGAAKFFSDAACSTQINSVTINAGASTGNFFYEDGTVGTPTITVASTGLTSVVQAEAITGLRFGTTAFSVAVNACSPAITLQSANTQGGNPTSLTQTTTINLSSSSAGGKFYSDAACTTQIASTTIGPSIDAGHDSPSFFYKDANAGTPTLTGSAGTASATQAETITKLTPTFTVPASQSITFGTATLTLSGTIASGTNFPPSGETVNITINGVTTPATIGNNGAFSTSIDTHAIPASATPYTITYNYAGDANFNSATNTATTLTVNKGTTSTSLASSQNPSFTSQQVTFTATVSLTTGSGVPTGSVQFQDGGVNVGSPVALTNNGGVFTATFQTSSLSVGTHNITTVYSGDNNFGGSTSNSVSQVVNNPATTTAVSSSLNPSNFGQSVMFSVTVTSRAGTPTGSVVLYDGACGTNPISGAIALNSGGQASFTTSALSAASHTIFACYTPTGVFLASSGSVVQIVNKATAQISVTPYNVFYDGMSHTATGTATGVGGADLSADLNLSGTTHTNAGDYPSDGWTFTDPAGNYNSASGSVHDVIGKATAQITVTPYNVTYDGNSHTATGTATGIGGIDLSADLNLTGTTHTDAKTYSDTWTFTDPTGNYNSASNTIQDVINQVLVTITLSNLTQTYDGNPKAVTFIASPNRGGVVVTYTGLSVTYPASQNPPITAGTYTVTAMTTDPNFAGNASGTLTINKATPIINWSNPADITYGTALSGTQLNAAATFNNGSVTGTFTYNPPAGTVLPAGNAQTLSTDFAPDDAIDFNAVLGTTVLINVKADPLYVISSDGARAFGVANPAFTPTIEGLVNGDTAASIGNPSCASTANSTSTLGTYAALCSGVTSTNYNVTYVNGTLSITNPLSTITVIKDKNGDSGSETLQIGQTDVLTAFGQFADNNTRALASAGGMSFSRGDLTTPVYGAAVAEAGGMLYAIGGTDASHTVQKIIQAYNPKTNTWNTISAQLATARTNAAVASSAGRIFVVGGSDGNNPLASIEVLDTTSGTPTISAFSGSLSMARKNAAAVVWKQTLYVIGGDNGSNPQSTVDIFDLVHGTSSASDAGTALDASAAVLNNKLYVFGTNSGSVQVITFDGTNWSGPSTAGPLDASKGVGAVAFTNLIYVVNGSNVWSYDGTNFAQESNPLGNEHDSAQPVAIGSRLYVASAGSAATNSKLDAFAPDEVNWSTADSTKATIDNAGNLAAVGRTDPNTVALTATSLASSSITGGFQLTVIRKTQTINFGALSNQTYGNAEFLISAASVDSSNNPTNLVVNFSAGAGDSCTVGASTLSGGTSSATVHITGAGSCTITAAQPGDDSTWSPAQSVLQSFTINKATPTVVVSFASPITYDGNSHAATAVVTGVNNTVLSASDGTVTITYTPGASTAPVGAGSYSASAHFASSNPNYNDADSTTAASLTINKAHLTVTADDQSRFYGDANPSLTATITGFVNNETLSTSGVTGIAYCTTSATPASPVSGSPYAITCTQGSLAASNYDFTNFVAGKLTVNKAHLTVTANDKSRGYGDANLMFDATISGFKNNEIPATSGVTGYASCTSIANATSSVAGSPYDITCTVGTLAAGNYDFTSFVTGHLTITRAHLSVAADNQQRIYGDPNPAFTFKLNGFKNSETAATANVSGSPTLATTATATSSVAGSPYPITVIDAGTLSAPNYDFPAANFVNGALTVTPRPATWTTNPNSKTYGDADPSPLTTGSGTNFITADGVTATYTRVAGETVAGGPYHITATLAPAAVLSNYNITNAGADFTVSKRNATWTTNPSDKTYGDADPSPLTTGSGTNFITADGITATYARTAGETVAGSPYHITATLSSTVPYALNNYNVTNTGASFTIKARNATWTTNPSGKTYGDADLTPLTTGSGTNFVTADGVTATYTRVAGETVGGGPYHITATLAPAAVLSNYNVTNAGADFTIDKRNATWTTNPNSKTYGDSDPNPLTTGSGTNFVAADGVTATYTRAAGETVSGGPYPITATLSSTVSGALSNYTITNAGASFGISQRNASVTPNPSSRTYGDSDPAFTGTLTNFVPGDGVTASYSRTAGEAVAGSPYTISATLSPAGVLGNYSITYNTAAFTITKRNASVTPNPSSKVYGSTDPVFTGTLTNFVPADNVTATYQRTVGETVPGSPYTISAALSPGAVLVNYTITYNTAQFTITPAPLTITASSGVMTYGTSPFVVTPVYSLFANGDTPLSVMPPPTCGPVFSSSTSAGPYGTSCTGAADPNYNINYVSGNVVVTQATTAALVVSSSANNTSTFMQLVTFTATVADNSAGSVGTPTGTVTFYNGNASLGTVALSVVGGQGVASLSTTSLPATSTGTYDNITAVYNGDNNFTGSTSPVLQQTVQPAPIVSLNPTALSFGNTNVGATSTGQNVTLTNVGDAPLTLGTGSISVTGPNAGDFITTTNCGSSLGYAMGSNSCTITVKFKPSETGVEVATLVITDNDDDSVGAQQFVSLTGSGLSAITGTSLYTDAIFATSNSCGALTLSGGSMVDSFNSSQGSYSASDAPGGNVGTNGNITLSGSNSAIHGTAFVDSTTTGSCSKSAVTGLTTSGGAQVTGGLMALNGPITYPAPPAANPVPPTTAQNVTSCPSGMTGCTNVSSKVVRLAPGQYGNVSISGGTTAHISAGTYNLNSLNLSGKSILYVDSGPVVVNIAGASLSNGAAAMDVTGGSIQNPSHIPANLQFAYGGSHGVNLSGGSDSYAVVYAPNALINMSGGSDFFGSVIGSTVTSSGGTNVHYDSNLPNIQAGNLIWFTAVVNNVSGLPASQQVKLYLTNSSISFTANNSSYTVPVANSVVTFNSASQSSGAKTGYDLANNRWSTNVAKTGLTGNTFVAGVAFQVPTGGFPTGIQNVTWSSSYSTDTPGVTLQWQWAAGVYTSLNTTYATSTNSNVLGVNPEDGSGNAYGSDPAGTPEAYKQFATFGATGGFFSAASGVVPTVAQMSVSPSSLSFGSQTVGTVSGQQIAVLTNNYTNSFNISGISVGGTNAADFSLVPNGPSTPNNCLAVTSLPSGASCTLYATFTPSFPNFESAKIAITDGANNSPQTVFLTGTGQ